MNEIIYSDEWNDDCSQEDVRKMSSIEFEKYCETILGGFLEETGITNYHVTHNVKRRVHDGTYQIDVNVVFQIDKLEISLLCECKQHKNPIKRDYVATLYQKMQSIGAQKGILMATSDFQKGAIKFAKEHGIALIKVYDYKCEYLSHSSDGTSADFNDPFLIAEKMMPPVRAIYYSTENDEPVLVYPTHRAMEDIRKKQTKFLKAHGLL